jgi:RNA polymerase sigma-70 factor (ECF subfamily)
MLRGLRSPVADASDDLGFDATVAAAISGEHWALTQLFRVYQPMLLRYLRSQVPAIAEDLASEVWVAVARRLGRFVGDEPGFRGWLFTIARCRVIEHHRRVGRRRTDPVPTERLDRASVEPDGGDPARLVSDRLSARDAVDVVVASLPPDQAEVVLLRVVAGLDVAEVSRIMGRTPGSVRVLCHRGLRRLATRLSVEVLAQ